MNRFPAQQAAFATGVLPDLYAFHRYTRNSACPYRAREPASRPRRPGVEPRAFTRALAGRLRALYAQ